MEDSRIDFLRSHLSDKFDFKVLSLGKALAQCREKFDMNLADVLKLAGTIKNEINALDLNENNLEEIPSEIQELQTLHYLFICRNHLTSLPFEITSLNELEYLIANDNDFSEVPDVIGCMTSLQHLSFAHCKLTTINSSLFRLQNLKNLDLPGNAIHTIPKEICLLKNVERLVLRENKIQVIPVEVGQLSKLQQLSLSFNKIQTLPESLGNLEELNVLKLNDNYLTSLPTSLKNLKHLSSVDVACNRLKAIPEFLLCLPSMRSLNCTYNQIRKIPSWLYDMSLLSKLHIGNNPLEEPLGSLWRLHRVRVSTYLQEIHVTERVKTSTLKVLVLGEPEAGKTSVLNTLKQGASKLTGIGDRTIVVDEKEWRPTSDTAIRFIDFGGHFVYRILYPLFLSQQSFCVLAVDLYQDEEKICRDFHGWVDLTIAQCQSLVILATKTDLIPLSEVESRKVMLEKMLAQHCRQKLEYIDVLLQQEHLKQKEKISSLQECRKLITSLKFPILRISSKKNTGFQQLKDILEEDLMKRSITIPKSWHKTIMTALDHIMKQGFINTSQLVELHKEKATKVVKTATVLKSLSSFTSGIEAEIDTIMTLVHCCGFALHFKGIEGHRDILVSPNYLVKLLKAVFHHDLEGHLKYKLTFARLIGGKTRFHERKTTFIKNGLLYDDLLQCLWKQFQLPEDIYGLLVTVLDKYGIWYKSSAEEKNSQTTVFYRIPWIVQEKQPPAQISGHQSLDSMSLTDIVKLKCVWEFLFEVPQSLFERSSVKLQHHLPKVNYIRHDWCQGVFVQIGKVSLKLSHMKIPNGKAQLCLDLWAPVDDLYAMWELCKATINDVIELLGSINHVIVDEYMECAHCLLIGNSDPVKLPVDILLDTCSSRNSTRQCPNSPGEDFPAALVCPLTNDDPHQKTHVSDVKIFLDNIDSSGHEEESDRWHHRAIIRKHKVALVECINVQDGLYTQMRAHGILTQRQVSRYKYAKCPMDQVEMLLEDLGKRPPEDYSMFRQCLIQDKQAHVVNLYLPEL